MWTVMVHSERENDYLSYARSDSLAMFAAQPGCLGVLFLRSSNGEHSACSLWKDSASLSALANNELYRSTAAGLLGSGAIAGEPRVEVYEVKGGMIAADLAETVTRIAGKTESNC